MTWHIRDSRCPYHLFYNTAFMVNPILRTLVFSAAAFAANMPPPEYQKLAHDVYKQLIEINTSYSTGATTPAAQAISDRLRSEGFPASDIQMVGAAPHKMNVVVRYHGTGADRKSTHNSYAV